MNNYADFQKINQANIEVATKFFGEWGKGWQAIAAEMTDYTKRSFEQGTATVEKLANAKSVEQAFEIQTEYAKTSYDEYVKRTTKLAGMYTDLAKDVYKPLENVITK